MPTHEQLIDKRANAASEVRPHKSELRDSMSEGGGGLRFSPQPTPPHERKLPSPCHTEKSSGIPTYSTYSDIRLLQNAAHSDIFDIFDLWGTMTPRILPRTPVIMPSLPRIVPQIALQIEIDP